MAKNWDAEIKLVFPADDGTTFTADTVKHNEPFDIVANVEVGANLMQFASSDELFVAVKNLSRSTTILQGNKPRTLTAVDKALNENLRVDIASGWGAGAAPGDLLQVVATYRMDAGIHSDYSSAQSQSFIVIA